MNLHSMVISHPIQHLLILLMGIGAWTSAAGANSLVREDQARRLGLQRAWFSQVNVNPGRNSVVRAVLADDEIVVLTTGGVMHVLDAETGVSRWIERIGKPRYPSLGPAADDTHLAIINGSTLYVFDKKNRREILRKPVGGGPSAGPALGKGYVFVPLFNGRIEGYSLSDPKQSKWMYQSAGRVFMRPVTTANRVVWASDAGYLYGADSKGEGVRYRFESLAPIAAPPAAKSPFIYAVAEDGYVFALNEDTGRLQWRHATGWPARYSPVVIGDNLYVATDEPALHCLATDDGAPRWTAIGVAQFVAASPTRVYGMDRYGGLMILDGRSGVTIGQAAGEVGAIAVLNEQTDRLYVVSDSGLVQCLHEVGQSQPFRHVKPPAEEAPAMEEAPAEPAPTPEEPMDELPVTAPEPDEENPFDDNPFGEAPTTPPGDAPESNPFEEDGASLFRIR